MFGIAVFLIVFGLVLPIALTVVHRNFEFSWIPQRQVRKSARETKLVQRRCDCGADTLCPNGRQPLDGGDPYRCVILVSEDKP